MAWSIQDFKRIGVSDGLPNATIYSVTQDSQGYIWLTSTNSGLLRFDGYQFTEFQVLTPEEKKQLGSQDVGYLLIDRDKNMWAGTWGYGLSRIDGTTGALTRYVADPLDDNALASMQIQTLLQTKDGSIWIGSTGGLNRVNADGQMQRIASPKQAQSLVSPRVWSLAQTADGTLWVGTSKGLHAYSEQQGLSDVILPFPNGSGRDNEIRALFSNNDQLWVGTRQGLFQLDPGTQTLRQVPFFAKGKTPIINTIAADQDGMLLLGTYNGLYRVHPKHFEFITFRQKYSLLPTVNIRSIYLDRTGVLWLGSRESGLFFARHSKSAFTQLSDFMPPALKESLSFGITSVYAKDEVIWLGSAEHLYRVDKQAQTFQSYATGGRVNIIKPDHQGRIYTATDSGLFRFDATANQLEAITEPFELAQGVTANIRDLTIETDGSMWIGLWGDGVLHWQPSTEQRPGAVRKFLHTEITSKVGDAVQAMLVTDTNIWVGSRYSGVFQIDRSNGRVTNLSENPASGLKLPSLDVQCIEPGPDGALLICTAKGLVIYKPAQQQQQLLDIRSGLPSDNITTATTALGYPLWFTE